MQRHKFYNQMDYSKVIYHIFYCNLEYFRSLPEVWLFCKEIGYISRKVRMITSMAKLSKCHNKEYYASCKIEK